MDCGPLGGGLRIQCAVQMICGSYRLVHLLCQAIQTYRSRNAGAVRSTPARPITLQTIWSRRWLYLAVAGVYRSEYGTCSVGTRGLLVVWIQCLTEGGDGVRY